MLGVRGDAAYRAHACTCHSRLWVEQSCLRKVAAASNSLKSLQGFPFYNKPMRPPAMGCTSHERQTVNEWPAWFWNEYGYTCGNSTLT